MPIEQTNFEQENKKLRAELSILRANLSKIEKENDNLKQEKSKFIVNKLEIEHELKKKLDLKDKESRIEENQRKLFKSSTIDFKDAISPKFILKNTLDFTNLDLNANLEQFLKKLKFFKDFFFDDFYSINDEKAMEIVDYFYSHNQKDFLEAFDLFSCKKQVFLKFLPYVYSDNSYVKIKISCLLDVPLEWLIEVYDTQLKRFITTNKSLMVELYANIAEKCPFYLKKVLDKPTFNDFITDLNPKSYKLLYFVATQRIKDFIDETNLHLIPSDLVMYYYSLQENDFINIY